MYLCWNSCVSCNLHSFHPTGSGFCSPCKFAQDLTVFVREYASRWNLELFSWPKQWAVVETKRPLLFIIFNTAAVVFECFWQQPWLLMTFYCQWRGAKLPIDLWHLTAADNQLDFWFGPWFWDHLFWVTKQRWAEKGGSVLPFVLSCSIYLLLMKNWRPFHLQWLEEQFEAIKRYTHEEKKEKMQCQQLLRTGSEIPQNGRIPGHKQYQQKQQHQFLMIL